MKVLSDEGYEVRRSEGWSFNLSVGIRPRRFHSCAFSTDEEAIAFVQRRAAEGSEMHIEAITKHIAIRMTGE